MYDYLANAATIFNSSQYNFIQYNWMGFRQEGATVLLNTDLGPAHKEPRGVGIASSWNTIRSNTISGVDNGITVGDPFESASTAPYVTNSFSLNKIGTAPTGMTGTPFANASYGIVLLAGENYNWVLENAFGSNGLGSYWIDPSVTGTIGI